MATRRCPVCQTAAEPKVENGRELCANCELQLPPADSAVADPPRTARPVAAKPAPKVAKVSRDPVRSSDRDWDDDPKPRSAKPDTADRRTVLMVLLLVGAFILMVVFFAGVIVIKTQFTTPSTRPAWQNGPWGPQPNGPWDGPGIDDDDRFRPRTFPTVKD